MRRTNWLEDVNKDRVFHYKNENGATVSGTIKKLSEVFGVELKAVAQEKIQFNDSVYRYAGFDPVQLRQKNIIEFEKNGRKAVMIRDADGKVTYRSKSKIHYEKTGNITNQMSSEYQAAQDKEIQNEMRMREHAKKNPGQHRCVDPLKEALKNLSDGEYVSDGHSFKQVEQGAY